MADNEGHGAGKDGHLAGHQMWKGPHEKERGCVDNESAKIVHESHGTKITFLLVETSFPQLHRHCWIGRETGQPGWSEWGFLVQVSDGEGIATRRSTRYPSFCFCCIEAALEVRCLWAAGRAIEICNESYQPTWVLSSIPEVCTRATRYFWRADSTGMTQRSATRDHCWMLLVTMRAHTYHGAQQDF